MLKHLEGRAGFSHLQKVPAAERLWLLVAALCAAHLWIKYPGILHYNVAIQYNQAATGNIGDWHPPIFSWVWSKILYVADGIAPWFVMQILLLWLGVGLVAHGLLLRSGWRAAGCAVLVAMVPNIWAQMFWVVKDTCMAASLMAAFGMVFYVRERGGPAGWGWRIAIVLLLSFGVLLRINAVFGAAALVMYATRPQLLMTWRRGAVWLAVYGAVILAAVTWCNDKLAVHHDSPVSSMLVYDVLGTAHFSRDTSLLPEDITLSEIDRCYTPLRRDKLGREEIFHCTADTAEINLKSKELWRAMVAAHPLDYLWHRLLHFNETTYGFVPRHHDSWFPYIFEPETFIPKWVGAISLLNLSIDVPMWVPVFRASFLLVLGVVLLWAHAKLPHAQVDNRVLAVRALSLCGVLYILSYGLVGVSTEFRYQFWGIICVAMALVIALSREPKLLAQKPYATVLVLVYIALLMPLLWLPDPILEPWHVWSKY